METITTAIDTVTGLITSVIGVVTDSPMLMVFVAASFVGVGVSLFKRLKG